MDGIWKTMVRRFVKDQVHTLWNGDAAVKRTHQGFLFRRTHVSSRNEIQILYSPNLADSSISTDELERWEKNENYRKIGKNEKRRC